MINFEEKFDELIAKRRDGMKEQFNRVLPTGETLFNRFDKAEYLNAGKGSSIYDESIILGDVKFEGDNIWIGAYTIIDSVHGQVTLGDNVVISQGSMIFTHDSSKNRISGGKNPVKVGNVTIEDNAFISTRCTIFPNVRIGHHSLIASNTTVHKDVPPYSIVMGIPGRIVGKVVIDEEGYVSYELDK